MRFADDALLLLLPDRDLGFESGMCGRSGALKCSEGASVRCERLGAWVNVGEELRGDGRGRGGAMAAREEDAEAVAAGWCTGR